MTTIEDITKELRRIGVDAKTLGSSIRGVRCVDGGGGTVALFESKMGPLYVSRPQTLLERLQGLPGAKGATDGLHWFWKEVFIETVEPELEGALDDLTHYTKVGSTADVHRSMVKLHALGVETEYIEEGELGEELAIGKFLSMTRYDTTHAAPEANWDEVRKRATVRREA